MLKRVLIVFAHQEPKSLNATLKNYAIKLFEERGFETKVSDLYAQKFDPVIKRNDIIGIPTDKDHIRYSSAASEAYATKSLAPYIQDEIDKVTWADLIYFQFPIYWYSMPAILKGWFEKVLVCGFAFDIRHGGILDNGLLKDKYAMLSLTTGASKSMFTPTSINGDINVSLWPIQYSLHFCGLNILKPFIVYNAESMTEDILKDTETSLKERLSKVNNEKPIEFISLANYSFPSGQLNDSYLQKMSDVSKAPNVGQHLGKQIQEEI
ncbi:NAD(P)H dehydrogenase [quinone] 1-like [Argonauta hians]